MLKSGRDPNRKYEEEPSEEEDDSDEEVEEEEAEGEDENVDDEEEEGANNDSSSIKNEPNIEESTTENKATEECVKTLPPSESQPKPVSNNAPVVEVAPPGPSAVKVEPPVSVPSPKADVSLPKKPHVDIRSRRFDKSPEVKLKKDKVVEQQTKQLNPEEFAQHIEKLKSEKILLPLLSSPLPYSEPPRGGIESLKTKINMKFNMIKPVLTNEVIRSKIEEVKNNKDLFKKVVVKREDNSVNNYVMQMNKGKESTSRAGKPGLKLEQILKSKLAQKLAAHEPTPEPVAPAVETSPPETSTSTEAVAGDSSKTEPPADNAVQPRDTSPPISSQPTESPLATEPTAKRKLSHEVEIETKKAKLDYDDEQPTDYTKNSKPKDDNDAAEIEEPLMLVTGVGSGAECQSDNILENQVDDDEREFVLFVQGTGSGVDCASPNEGDDEDEREFCLFISGPGSGVECLTGNNEANAEESSDKEKPPVALTHKVENILSSKGEVDADQSTTSVGSSEETPKKSTLPAPDDSAEKKKPKLWTIDAICNSDSSKETSKKEDISCFPNFSFNKDKKPEMSYRNEFSFFNMPRSEPKENDSMPTNFYFGSDTQIPPYVATDVRNSNNIKAAKSHNVKDIVQLDREEDKQSQAQVYSSFTNSHTEQVFNLCTRQSPPTVTISTETGLVKAPETVYSNVMSLSTSNEVKQNQNESKNSTDAIISNDASSPVKNPETSRESDLGEGKSEPESRPNFAAELVEDITPEKEVPSITESTTHILEPEKSSKTNQSTESTSVISASIEESKPTEIPSEQDISLINESVAEEVTSQTNENIIKGVSKVTLDEPILQLDPSKDVAIKESIENNSAPEDISVQPEIEASQPETVSEKDVKSSKIDEKETPIEPVVENSTESVSSEDSRIKEPSLPVQETVPKSDPISEPPKCKLVQEILPEPEPLCQESGPEPEITPEIIPESLQTVDEVKETKPDPLEADKLIAEKEESSSISVKSIYSKEREVKSVPEESNDQPNEPLSSAYESPESDDDYCAAPSPPSPESVSEENESVEPIEEKPIELDSAKIAAEEKLKEEAKIDEAPEPPKGIQEPPAESIAKDSKSSTEETHIESEPAIKQASPVKHAEPEPKPDKAIEESLPAVKETSLPPPEVPLEKPEPISEQITEQNTMPTDEEKPTPTEEPKSVKETTPPPSKATPTPEKKYKKSKISSEEPVLRTSSRISTRSTRKDSTPKKEEDEEEDDRKSAKTTPSKAKQAEPKTGKKGKAAAKLAKEVVAVEEDEKVESPPTFTPPVTSKYVKKTGKGRKKWGRGAKTTSGKFIDKDF